MFAVDRKNLLFFSSYGQLSNKQTQEDSSVDTVFLTAGFEPRTLRGESQQN